MTTIILVRHGETPWNSESKFRGRANIELNEAGEAQARATAQYIAQHWPPEAVYCSPLLRARQTAEVIAQPFMLHERSHPGLLDIDYGAWEGMIEKEVHERWPQALNAWFTRPHEAPIPGGEMLNTVRLRAMGALNEIAQRHQGETVVIVGHTVVNRLLLLGILNAENASFWRLRQDVGAVNVIDFEDNRYTLVKVNDTCHLEGGVLPESEAAEPETKGANPSWL